jgi:predicted transcriptional regulator
VITILNIMVRKKYLRRTKRGKAYVFRARVNEKSVTRGMLHDLVDRAFDGSATSVMLQLLETSDISRHELEKLRQLIDRATKEP